MKKCPLALTLRQRLPLHTLFRPRGDPSNGPQCRFRHREPAARRLWKAEHLLLEIRRQPGEHDDLAHALPADAAQTGQVGVVPDLAPVQHVLKVDRQGDHLHDPRVAVEAAAPHVLPGLFVRGPVNRPYARLQLKCNLERIQFLLHFPSLTSRHICWIPPVRKPTVTMPVRPS
jgi:hypothetical protein